MKKSKLNAADKLKLQGLKREDVERTISGLKPFFKKSRWIGSNNHYGKDVVGKLELGAPKNSQHNRQLAQYIAASLALHANDGWSYLGRAAACILAGDSHRALHLAYYAELRAAMSLLAGAGVGVFNRKHYVISAADSTSKLQASNGTHIMAWLALEEWAQRPDSGALFSSLVQPEGLTLDEWFQPEGGASSIAPQARAWFMQWGMDLGLATKDRDARNESSYRPDGLLTTWKVDSKDGLEFVRDMWRTLEPSSKSSFEQIDLHILRLAVERLHFSRNSRQARADDAAYVALVNRIVDAQNLATATEQRLKRFLLRQSAPSDPKIFDFSKVTPGRPQSDAFAVMARAVLLLRIATGATHLLFNRVGFDANELGFWWRKIGEVRGLWQPGEEPGALADLWADIDDSLRDVAEVEASSPELLESLHAISTEMSESLIMLASHERVSLWGLCPA